jgi:hypothetical protein
MAMCPSDDTCYVAFRVKRSEVCQIFANSAKGMANATRIRTEAGNEAGEAGSTAGCSAVPALWWVAAQAGAQIAVLAAAQQQFAKIWPASFGPPPDVG